MKIALGVLAVLVALAGAGIVFDLMFTGPRMRGQLHIRAFEQRMPLPPSGIVAVAAESALPSAAEAAGVRNPLPDTPENRARGKVYYGYYCAFCHGARGDGEGDVGPSYVPPASDIRTARVRALADGELLRAMLTGTGHEPLMEQTVHAEHRWPLALYVRSLANEPSKENK